MRSDALSRILAYTRPRSQLYSPAWQKLGGITVRKNTGADVGMRPRLNLIEGSNVTLTVTEDLSDNEIDITIGATGGGTAHNILSATHTDTTGAGSEATGDILYRNASSQWTRRAIGSAGQVLKAAGTPLLPTWGTVDWSELTGTQPSPIAHASSHQNGGGDEINVGGLSGLLADAQTPATHEIDSTGPHESGTVLTAGWVLRATGASSFAFGAIQSGDLPTHASTHQNGGADEISVAGLSGLLGDAQTPVAHAIASAGGYHTASGLTTGHVLRATAAASFAFQAIQAGDLPPHTPSAHASSHENGGGDEINVGGLSGVLATPQTPTTHDITSSYHAIAAETPGYFLKVTGTGSTFAWAPHGLTYSDVGAAAASHEHDTGDITSGLPWAKADLPSSVAYEDEGNVFTVDQKVQKAGAIFTVDATTGDASYVWQESAADRAIAYYDASQNRWKLQTRNASSSMIDRLELWGQQDQTGFRITGPSGSAPWAEVIAEDDSGGAWPGFGITEYGTGSAYFWMWSQGGTLAVPSNTTADQVLGYMEFGGYASGNAVGGAIVFTADQNWVNGDTPAHLDIYLTPDGSGDYDYPNSPALTLYADKSLAWGGGSAIASSDDLVSTSAANVFTNVQTIQRTTEGVPGLIITVDDASSGNTLRPSDTIILRGKYWDGLGSNDVDATLYSDPTTTGGVYRAVLDVNAHEWYFKSTGDTQLPGDLIIGTDPGGSELLRVGGVARIEADFGTTEGTILTLEGGTSAPRFDIELDSPTGDGGSAAFRVAQASGSTYLKWRTGGWGHGYFWGLNSSAGVKYIARLNSSGTGAASNEHEGRFSLYTVSDAQADDGSAALPSLGTETVRIAAADDSFFNGGGLAWGGGATITSSDNVVSNPLSGEFTINPDDVTSPALTIGRYTSAGRAFVALANETPTRIWEYGMRTGGSENWELYDYANSRQVIVAEQGGELIFWPSTHVQLNSDVQPQTNNSFDLGANGAAFAEIWAYTYRSAADLDFYRAGGLKMKIGSATVTIYDALDVEGLLRGDTLRLDNAATATSFTESNWDGYLTISDNGSDVYVPYLTSAPLG